MVSIDLPIAISIFFVFFVATTVFVVNYISKLPTLTGIQEFGEKATDLYDAIFESKGTPETWEETDSIPSQPGVIIDFYKIPISVKETAGLNRTDESIEVNITFDDDCENKTWNNTVRIYDRELNESAFELSNESFCSEQWLKNATITFNVNISANQTKIFDVYYYRDKNISAPNHTLTTSTTSWIPNDGDSWTESVSDWARYAGSSGTPTLDSTNKKVGSASTNITGNFDSSALGLEYNPSSNITGIGESNWYLRAWLLVNDVTGLSSINVSMSDNQEIIYTDVLSEMSSNSWYLFEKEISSSNWNNWTSFNASDGIDFVSFFAVNNTAGTKTVKIDGLRFEKNPLTITTFPEETVEVISSTKIKTLRDLGVEEISHIIGQGYKFRIEIEEST